MTAIALGVAKLVLPIVVKEIKEAAQRGKVRKALKRAQKSGKGYHAAVSRALRRHKQTTGGYRVPSLSRAVDSGASDSDEGEARGQGYAEGDSYDDDAVNYQQKMARIARANEKERRSYAEYVASLDKKKGRGLPTFAYGHGDDLDDHELHEFW
jgi:hypothetical protein